MKNMKNLESFEVPNDGEISLCEINGRMQAMNYNCANVNAFTDTLECYPKIHITRDLLHTSKDEGKALFLPVNVSFLKQLTQIYYEQGFIKALHTASAYNKILISGSAKIVLNILKYVDKIRALFNPNIKYSKANLMNQFSQTRDWLCNTIRYISWHPYTKKVAVVTCDDSVRIFNSDNTISPLLRYKLQKNVTCIAWRNMSNSEIAVGHENGIMVWNIDANSLVARTSISNTLFLRRSNHTPVMSICWSPQGDKLVSCAACDNTILIWDIELDKTSSLKTCSNSGNILIKWSPTGEKLFSCSNGLEFRVWNCYTWESEKWTVLDSRIQTACWSNCGTTLLFATSSEAIIYGLLIKTDKIFTANVETSSRHAMPIVDTTKINIDGVIIGGLIQYMEIDPKGKHLAVLFQDTNCVAVFNIVRQPTFQIIPSSLVIGLPEEKPSIISFLQHFKAGACLTIGWSSGRIQYYPIIYTDLSISDQINTSLYSKFNTSPF